MVKPNSGESVVLLRLKGKKGECCYPVGLVRTTIWETVWQEAIAISVKQAL